MVAGAERLPSATSLQEIVMLPKKHALAIGDPAHTLRIFDLEQPRTEGFQG